MLTTLEMLRDSSLLVVLRCADVVVGRRVIDFGRRCCFAAVLFVVRILILFPNRQVIDSARRRRFAAVLFVVGILILFPDRWGIGSGRRRCFAAVLFVVGFCFGSLTVNIVSVITLYLAKFREQARERAAFSSVWFDRLCVPL